MKTLRNVSDIGIVLSPSSPDEPYYAYDGGGVREAVLKQVNGKFILTYDGAAPGEKPDSYWNACEAESDDLIHWRKCGPTLLSSGLTHPEASAEVYPDFCSASSPWDFSDGDRWYRYYLAADHCSPAGIPSFAYRTMLAVSDHPRGPWKKVCDKPGKEGHVCFPLGKPGDWDDETASPGEVIKVEGEQLPYLMFYSGSCKGETKRSIGLARTDDPSTCDNFRKEKGHFWVKDALPILPPSEDIENSSLFFEEESGYWYLFTNHIKDNSYTDAVWVYRTKDIFHWNAADKAIAMDARMSAFAKGAVGMPSVMRIGNKLALLYDGTVDGGIGHLHRHIGLAFLDLPLAFGD